MTDEPSTKELESFIEKIGFGQYKKQVYLAIFKLKEASIYEIGRVSKVPLPKIYGIVNELEDQGFISLILAKPRKYAIIHPQIVFSKIIDEKHKQLSDLRYGKDRIINLFNSSNKEKENIFEIMRGREKVLYFLSNELKFNTIKSYWAIVAFNSVSTPLMSIIRRKAKKGLDVRVVGPEGKEEVAKKYVKLGATVRIVNEVKEPIRLSIYDSKRLAFTLTDIDRDYVTLWTDSASLVKNMKNLFLFYWNSGRDLNGKIKTRIKNRSKTQEN